MTTQDFAGAYTSKEAAQAIEAFEKEDVVFDDMPEGITSYSYQIKMSISGKTATKTATGNCTLYDGTEKVTERQPIRARELTE